MRSKLLCLFFTGVVLSCQAPKEENETLALAETASPASVGLIADSLDLIRDHIQWAIDSQYIAGGVALVARAGKIVWYEAVGFSDNEKKEAMEKDDIFRIASMTKPITTTAVMQLYEQGRLDTKD